MDFLNTIMISSLLYFVKLTNSYGMAIVLLTVTVRLILWPLVSQSTISMQKMSKLQPKMQEIQQKYKSDPQMLQAKLAEFYKENKVNPLGGCLPMLIQIPVFIALYYTFSGPPFADRVVPIKITVVDAQNKSLIHSEQASSSTCNYIDKSGAKCKLVAFPGDSTVAEGSSVRFAVRASEGTLPEDLVVDWKAVAKDKQLKNDVSIDADGNATFKHIGEFTVEARIPGIAKNDSFGFIHGLGKIASGLAVFKPQNFDILILIVLFGATMFWSQKFTMPQTAKKPDEELDEAQIVQQQTMKTMPIMMTAMFIFIPIPTGVLIYMVISNVMQTVQTFIVQKFVINKEPAVVLESGNVITIGSDSKSKNVKTKGQKEK